MPDNSTPIVLVVCNDYGELGFAMYLLEGQSFAENTTLMLPPRLYANNPDVLPGRTFLYHSLDDVRNKMDGQKPGILGLLSGYLLPIHRLCEPDALDSLLRSTQAKGWRSFTTDPFLGLLEDMAPDKLITLKPPRWSIIWFVGSIIGRRWVKRVLTKTRRALEETLHVYPFGKSVTATEGSSGARAHFHNSAFSEQHTPSASTTMAVLDSQRWLFVLADQDFTICQARYGSTFPLILMRKLHETLEAGRMPTLIAPAEVIEVIQKYSPVAHAMELLGHCGYPQFQSLLMDAEYVLYWNATSFSSILRILSGKPWFTFDEGHLLRGTNADYANRIFDWFYRGGKPPYIDMSETLSSDSMQVARQQFLPSAQRMQQGLLNSSNPQALIADLAAQRSAALDSNSRN